MLGIDGVTADMIADTSSTCSWLNHMYGLDTTKRGAQEYRNSLLALYKEWDVDFIKVDFRDNSDQCLKIFDYAKARKYRRHGSLAGQ